MQRDVKTVEGLLTGRGKRFGIVIGRFNELIGGKLLAGALDALVRHEVAPTDVTVAWCPGAFEIPLVAKRLAVSGGYDAIICVGAVIRGATPHFDYVAGEVAKGIAAVGLETGVPVIFGVLTTDTVEQALDRSGLKGGNKGADAALTAIEMVNLIGQVAGPTPARSRRDGDQGSDLG